MNPVVLVNMPWALLRAPSIQLSTVKALLARAGIDSKVLNFNLEWMQYLADHGQFEAKDYFTIAQAGGGLGEWVFAVPPFRDVVAGEIEEYKTAFAPETFAAAERMRALVPGFIQQCVDRVAAHAPAVVGFTTTFEQNVPCLLLTQELKRQHEKVITVFGGANCDGPMGEALHRNFSFIDHVVRGEAEAIVGPLFQELLATGRATSRPNVCSRNARSSLIRSEKTELPQMSDVPMPDHDDYFRDLPNMSFKGEIVPSWIPFEAARGCWWGQKHHCTFCGLNGNGMKFRSKPAERTLEELKTFSRKYRVTHFNATDNIIDMSYFEGLLPKLADSGNGFHIFYETKANLKKQQIQQLAAAGVVDIQPGIESLSTPILGLMNKGTTAMQNIRLLKWALEYGVEVSWNMLYGFPGEDPAEYEKMAKLLPALTHFDAPTMTLLDVHRFSPYHSESSKYGIRVSGPKWFYKYVYPLDEATLHDIAYAFDFEYDRPQKPAEYGKACVEIIDRWRKQRGRAKLEYRVGEGFMEISDTRNGERALHQLGETEMRIYLALDASATPKAVHEQLGSGAPSVEAIEAFCDQLVEMRLAYEEDGRYLSLAIPQRMARRMAA